MPHHHHHRSSSSSRSTSTTPSLSSYTSELPAWRMKKQAPQDSIDEFWAKFSSKTPGRVSNILPKNVYSKRASEAASKCCVVNGENAIASYTEAVESCKAKVEQIIKECRRVNQKYRDPHFDIEFDLKWHRRDCLDPLGSNNTEQDSNFSPQSVKRVGDIFDNPKFYIDGPTANDVRQGNDGDCWFLAALCTLGNKKDLIERVCVARDEIIGVYGFVFNRDGEWISEVIDDKLYLTKPDYDEGNMERVLFEDRTRINSEEEYRKIYQSNSGALYFAQCQDPNETWLPLLEKAYAKAHGDYTSIEGGFTGEGLEDLTGGVTTEILTTDILDKNKFWADELMKVNDEFLFGCATGIFSSWGTWGDRKGIYEGHAYSIMKAVEIDNKRLLLLKNPWGKGEWSGPWSDGSKEWTPYWMEKLDHKFGDDGAFWILYEDLLRKYQCFDRTRLFSDEWKVSQQWTSVQIPWTVDYLDTKFSFTLEKKVPVVIVLSQLDDRYFKGFDGQYWYELQFRVHKLGEEDYIVRSHDNYCMNRSVSVELELEAGEYHVLVKIQAQRNLKAKTIEDVIRENCRNRRDKLLRIGFTYDLAHSKGEVIETEEEKKGKKAAEEKKKEKERKEVRERLLKEKKKRRHIAVKEKRKIKAAKAKRDAKAAERAEKRKADQELADKQKNEDSKHGKEKNEKADNSEKEKGVQSEEIVDVSKIKIEEIPPSKEPAKEDNPKLTDVKEPSPEVTEKLASLTISTAPPALHSEASADTVEIRINGHPVSAPPSSIGDFDDFSDTDSAVSDITIGEVDEEIEIAAREDNGPLQPLGPAPPPPEEEEDEFSKDPWNAVAVVGLRVYSKGGDVSIKVIRPKTWEEDDKEQQLDVDDSAADATKKTEVAPPVTDVDRDKVDQKLEAAVEKVGEQKQG